MDPVGMLPEDEAQQENDSTSEEGEDQEEDAEDDSSDDDEEDARDENDPGEGNQHSEDWLGHSRRR